MQCSFHDNWCLEHSAEKRESKENQQQSDCIIFLNTNWPCQDNYCRLGDTDFLWQVRWKTYWFWGEYRKKKSLPCWMRSLRLFLRQILLIQRSWSWGNTFALNLEENYILLRMCFGSEPQSTTVLKSFFKPIVLFSLYIIILSIYQPSDSVIQYPFIEHLLFKVLCWMLRAMQRWITYSACLLEAYIVMGGIILIHKYNTKWKIL